MTVTELVSKAQGATKNQVGTDDLRAYLDFLQKFAFKKDLPALIVRANMDIYHELAVASFSASPVAGDVGKTIVGTTSGAQGTLKSYDGDSLVVLKTSAANFANAENFTTSGGTGAGTFSTPAQSVFKGPYAFPTATPVRKLIGITRLTDRQILGIDEIQPSQDYGMIRDAGDPRAQYLSVLRDEVQGTITFPADPEASAAADGSPYRWVYYQEAPTIDDLDDDAGLVMPARYHITALLPALIKIANLTLYEEALDESVLEPYFQGYWDDLMQSYIAEGPGDNQAQIGEGAF